MKPDQEITPKNDQQYLSNLYNRYAGMLLGYIFEIVKDRELAEEYMAGVFKSIAKKRDEFYNTGTTWCSLQQIARDKLSDFLKTINDCDNHAATYLDNKKNLLTLMNEEQRNIFCAVYYHGKTAPQLAKQLNQTELSVRKTLREAFAVIRKGREH